MKLNLTSILEHIAALDENPSITANGGEIYRIWFDNDPTGKCYVGQTVQGTLTRIKQHIDDANDGTDGGCPLLDEATRYYGINAMRYEILADGIQTHEELDKAERYFIKQYNSQYPNGYNVKSGGQGSRCGFTPIDGASPTSIFASMIGKTASEVRRDASIPQGNGSFLSHPVVNEIAHRTLDKSNLSDTTKGFLSMFL